MADTVSVHRGIRYFKFIETVEISDPDGLSLSVAGLLLLESR